MARRARVGGDIQVVDSVIETSTLGGLGPSFYSVPALVFRAGGRDVGVRIIPRHAAASCRLDVRGHRLDQHVRRVN